MLTLYTTVTREGGSLVEILKQNPVSGGIHAGGDIIKRIEDQVKTFEVHQKYVQELWEGAWQVAKQEKQVSYVN